MKKAKASIKVDRDA
jgi:hypothetical protein